MKATYLRRLAHLVFIPPMPTMMVKFSEVPINDNFIDPRGRLFRKLGEVGGTLLMNPDGSRGDSTIYFIQHDEQVEYVPRRPEPRVAFPGFIPHLMGEQHGN